MWHGNEEWLAAHQRAVQNARLIQREENETEEQTVKRARTPQESAKRKKRPVTLEKEADVLRACSELLAMHPRIAIWWRQSTGSFKVDDRYLKFSFVGASDLMAVSMTGRFIAVECKSTGKKATPEQHGFLDNVNKAGGLGVCVDHAGKLALALREV